MIDWNLVGMVVRGIVGLQLVGDFELFQVVEQFIVESEWFVFEYIGLVVVDLVL